MTLVQEVLAAGALVLAAPLTVWAERRVKAWTQMRRGPRLLQPYRDLRRLWLKTPLMPEPASPLFLAAPGIGLGLSAAALLLLPLWDSRAGLGGPASLIILGLVLTLNRLVLAAQAYDGSTAFTGMGASRELFLGGLAEPAFFLVAAAVFLETGLARVPAAALDVAQPATWLIAASLAFLWLAETARIPFDNPATHLELTMVHEAGLLESNSWMLAYHEAAAWIRQSLLGALLLLLLVPFPTVGWSRLGLLAVGLIALSGLFALIESAMAKVRLFRASHLLIMAALLAFLASGVVYLEGTA